MNTLTAPRQKPAPRLRRRLFTLVAIAAGSTIALAGCATNADTGSASADGAAQSTVTVALTDEPSSLDPLFDTNLPALNVFYNVFDQLATIDATGAVVPRLATSWTKSDDLMTWVFTLRDDAKFSDGTAVTADDVVFTYETAKNDPKSNLGGYLSDMTSVVATSPTEVTFTLAAPFAPWDRQTTLVPIVDKAAYTSMGAAEFAKKPVGSGPYSVEKWVKGDSITLTRNDSYWGNKGEYATVVFTPVPDETTRANSVQSGDLDIALLGPSQVSAVKASNTVDVVDQQSNRILYTGFNAKAKWLDDPNIRKAIDEAIDRTSLSDDLLNGSVTPTSQLVAAATFGFDTTNSATAFDLDAAKTLIAASGYDGSAITLSYPTTGLPQIDQIAQAIGGYLKAAGLNITLDGQETSTYSSAWFSASLPGIYLYAFAPSVMDADLPMTMLLKTGGQGYISDAEIDRLLSEQVADPDLTTRAADIASISKIVNENTYYAPLFIDTYTYGVKQGLDFTPRPDGFYIFN
ncbi:MAG: peptide/nickel transport system substrate-binding protein [Subtercola sp.]|nr:peptide/nickel transport system substrate-binding protein [Subtercola sp.]